MTQLANGNLASPPARSDALTGEIDQFGLLIEGVTDYAILMLDPEGRVTTWNQGAERIKGYSSEEVLGEHFSRFYLPEDARAGHPDYVLRMAEAIGRYEEEGWRVRRDGIRFWANIVVTAIFDQDGELRGFGKLVRDATERRDAERERERLMAELEVAAWVDDLTQLLNRRAWDEELSRELVRAKRYDAPVSMAVLDLDCFKLFNDDFGHLAGDEMLREVAAAWRPKLRVSDLLARFGGDEFAAMFPNCSAADAFGVVERMRGVTPARMTTSIGVAEWDGRETGEQLFDRADRALYLAKQRGRDRTVLAG